MKNIKEDPEAASLSSGVCQYCTGIKQRFPRGSSFRDVPRSTVNLKPRTYHPAIIPRCFGADKPKNRARKAFFVSFTEICQGLSLLGCGFLENLRSHDGGRGRDPLGSANLFLKVIPCVGRQSACSGVARVLQCSPVRFADTGTVGGISSWPSPQHTHGGCGTHVCPDRRSGSRMFLRRIELQDGVLTLS